MKPVEARRETSVEAALGNAAEVFSRRCRIVAAERRGDYDAVIHERLALGYVRADVERHARYVVPVVPVERRIPVAPRRDRRLNGGRPRGRRTASRSAAGGSSGDPDSDEPPLGRDQTARVAA